MIDRSEIPRLIATASATGDVEALAMLAIELTSQLAASEATLAELRHADDERRAGQRERKRRSRGSAPAPESPEVCHALSRDVTGQSVTDRDVTVPPPPSPSLLPPTPPNNPSSPPTPAAQRPQRVVEPEESRLLERAPAASAVITRMLDGFAGVQRTSWVGRLHGVLDRPPHPTDRELHDALEDMLTKPRQDWGPRFLRACVESIRREGGRSPMARPVSGASATLSAEAAVLWARYKAAGLLTRTGPEVLRTRGEQLVADGHYADYAAFHAEIAITKPWDFADARNDGWAINQLAARLAAPQQAAS